MKPKFTDFMDLLFIKSLVGFAIFLVMLIGCVCSWQPFYLKLGLYLSFILIFSSVDYLGWEIMIKKTEIDKVNPYDVLFVPVKVDAMVAYRVIQNIVLVLLLCIVFILGGKWVLLGCIVAWLFAVCDAMYYVMGKQFFPYAKYPWLDWTIMGFLLGEMTLAKFFISSLIGFIGGGILIWMK